MERPSSFTNVENITNADEIRQISCSEALHNDSRNLWLFTPALMVTHGGFDRDPVQEFDARFPLSSDYRPFLVQLTRDHEKFFDGLGVIKQPSRRAVNWDQRLYAIDEKHAQDCFDFLSGIAWSDPAKGYFANTMSYDMLIPDPTSRTGGMLPVKVFGVISNTMIAYLEERPGTTPLARCVPLPSGALPASLPRKNLMGVAPQEDPLNMREGD